MASAYRKQTPRINNMTDRSVRDRPDLGQLVKNCCVRTIRFPDWTSGIAPQVHCAHVLKTATQTTTHQLFEHFVTFDGVQIESEHRRPTIQKIELSVICCIADSHQSHPTFSPLTVSSEYDLRIDMDQTSSSQEEVANQLRRLARRKSNIGL